ncbi:MAG TPA: NAD(P)/FAD-dependent oxidoreductase [Tepidiformaceae bacterium]|nr:NAD(P)/FAD-dependent oxidoreductase [Tepidiformaceae bacterium]
MERFDVVIVGSGIAGGALATMLARGGKQVLLLERTEAYKDIVRGEWIAPWGLIDAKKAGLSAVLAGVSTHNLTYHVEYGEGIDPDRAEAERGKIAELMPGLPGPLAIGHPQACQALFDAAVAAGANAIRGVSEIQVTGGDAPCVAYTKDGARHEAAARLVVGADGRNSQVRSQAGIELHQDPPHHFFSGLLVDGVPEWPVGVQSMGTDLDVQYFVFPQGAGRHRLYLSYGLDQKGRLAGENAPQKFMDAFRLPNVRGSETMASGRIAGPCHSVPNQSTWTDDPSAHPGILLIGDAAGFNDPIVGQGLSISLRDARSVGELLLSSEEWGQPTFAPYVAERRERMRRLRFAANLDSVIHAEFGQEATARKLRFLEARKTDPTVGMASGAVMLGPEVMPEVAFTDEAWAKLMAI